MRKQQSKTKAMKSQKRTQNKTKACPVADQVECFSDQKQTLRGRPPVAIWIGRWINNKPSVNAAKSQGWLMVFMYFCYFKYWIFVCVCFVCLQSIKYEMPVSAALKFDLLTSNELKTDTIPENKNNNTKHAQLPPVWFHVTTQRC